MIKNNSHVKAVEQNGTSESDDSIYGEMNERDAKISGYTDENGHAVSMAKHDVKGSPTGSFTDIGAGRSSVVKKKSEMAASKTPAQIHSLDVTTDENEASDIGDNDETLH